MYRVNHLTLVLQELHNTTDYDLCFLVAAECLEYDGNDTHVDQLRRVWDDVCSHERSARREYVRLLRHEGRPLVVDERVLRERLGGDILSQNKNLWNNRWVQYFLLWERVCACRELDVVPLDGTQCVHVDTFFSLEELQIKYHTSTINFVRDNLVPCLQNFMNDDQVKHVSTLVCQTEVSVYPFGDEKDVLHGIVWACMNVVRVSVVPLYDSMADHGVDMRHARDVKDWYALHLSVCMQRIEFVKSNDVTSIIATAWDLLYQLRRTLICNMSRAPLVSDNELFDMFMSKVYELVLNYLKDRQYNVGLGELRCTCYACAYLMMKLECVDSSDHLRRYLTTKKRHILDEICHCEGLVFKTCRINLYETTL